MKTVKERALEEATGIAQPVLRSMWTSSRGAQRDLLRDMFLAGFDLAIEMLRSSEFQQQLYNRGWFGELKQIIDVFEELNK